MKRTDERIKRIKYDFNRRIKGYKKEYQISMQVILLFFVLGAISIQLVSPEQFQEIMIGFIVVLATISVLATIGYRKVVQTEKENTDRVIRRIYNHRKQREEMVKKFKKEEEERKRITQRKEAHLEKEVQKITEEFKGEKYEK